MNNIVTSEGAAKTTICALLFGAVLNIALDPLFIYVFDLGVAGAGIATAVSQVVSTCVYLSYILRRKSVFLFRIHDCTYTKEIMSEIFKIGIPTLVFQILTSSACGVAIQEDLQKGIIDRDVIEQITLTFVDENRKGHGKIIFIINWTHLEFLAKTDQEEELYHGFDFSQGYCQILDPRLKKALEIHVGKLRKEYNIKAVVCQFRYREKYRSTEGVHNASRAYMKHVKGEEIPMVNDSEFKNSLKATVQGLDDTLDVIFQFD